MPTIIGRVINRLERMLMGRSAYKWVLRDWSRIPDIESAARVFSTLRLARQIEPQVLGFPRGKRALVIAPHPDDEIIGPGGTLLKSVAAGIDVTVSFVTSGAKQDHVQREREAREACERAGFKVAFWGHEEGNIDVEAASVQLAELVNELSPDIVFLPFLLDDNNDHQLVNKVLVSALGSKDCLEIWAYQVYTPVPGNVVVDITDQVKQKASIIEMYDSQMLKRDWVHFAMGLNAVNSRFLQCGNRQAYSECFFVLPYLDYRRLCQAFFGEDVIQTGSS